MEEGSEETASGFLIIRRLQKSKEITTDDLSHLMAPIDDLQEKVWKARQSLCLFFSHDPACHCWRGTLASPSHLLCKLYADASRW